MSNWEEPTRDPDVWPAPPSKDPAVWDPPTTVSHVPHYVLISISINPKVDNSRSTEKPVRGSKKSETNARGGVRNTKAGATGNSKKGPN